MRSFHHIGVACESIEKEREKFNLFGYRAGTNKKPTKEWIDERLGMRGQFLGCGGAPLIELVAPHGDKSPVAPWLKQGTKLYHMGFSVSDIDAEIAELRKDGAKLMLPPTPAVAFAGVPVAFLMLPNLLLVELIGLWSPTKQSPWPSRLLASQRLGW